MISGKKVKKEHVHKDQSHTVGYIFHRNSGEPVSANGGGVVPDYRVEEAAAGEQAIDYEEGRQQEQECPIGASQPGGAMSPKGHG